MRIAMVLAVLAVMPSFRVCANPCTSAGREQITFRCSYAATPRSASGTLAAPRIVLNRALLLFRTDKEGYMMVELTFTNAGPIRIADHRTVYLAIDDAAGLNHLRRDLHAIDLSQLSPGKRIKFSDRLLSPAFRPGHYRISLWVPNVEPLVKFDFTHNFLFSSVGVPDLSTGLNSLGTFTVD
jgi:hypothetical protein